MDRWTYRGLGTVLGLVIMAAAPLAAAPVDLLEADSQVFLQDNGAADVIYTLTFRDNEGRRQIRKIGEFYEPVHFTRALIEGDGLTGAVALAPLGGGYYRAELPGRTSRGGTYRLVLHFRCNHRFADPTGAAGKELAAVWFNPVRWSLPVERSVIKLVLPLPFPQEVQRHEDITPEMVDALGVLTDQRMLDAQDHWAFVFTDYRGSRRLTLYAEKRNLPSQGMHRVRVYVPRPAFPGLSAGADVETSGAAQGERFLASGPLRLLAHRYTLATLARTAEDPTERGVLLFAELELEEAASRNFIADPPVALNLHRESRTVRAWLDGRELKLDFQNGKAHLGVLTRPGQRIRLEVTARYSEGRFARPRVVDGEAYLPVRLRAFAAGRQPGLDSAPVSVEVWSGLPPAGDGGLAVRPVAPREDWTRRVEEGDPEVGLPGGVVLALEPGPGPLNVEVLAPADPLFVPVGVVNGARVFLHHLLHGGLTEPDKVRATTFLVALGFLAILTFFCNFMLLALQFIAFGWVLAIVDAIAKTSLRKRAFGIAGGKKLIHPTRGLLFGWNALLVPLRLVWIPLRAAVLALLRLHPYLATRLAPPPPAYEAPEITVATFTRPGLVPDLTPPEAAVLAGRPIKAINLVVLELARRKALAIVSRNPLQVEVLDAARATGDVERAFLAALDPNGLLPAEGIRKVIETINAGLQPKIWRADLDATIQAQRSAVEEAWRRLREAPPAQRPMIFDEEYRHLYLDDRFFENLQGSMAGVDIPDSLDSPLGALASSRTVRTLEGAVSHVQEMAEGVVTSIENVAAATVDRVERFFAFDEMREAASADMRLHPLVFAGRMAEVTADRVSEEQLKAYFERIGNELSCAAAARWD